MSADIIIIIVIVIVFFFVMIVVPRNKYETIRAKKKGEEWFVMTIAVPQATKWEPAQAVGFVTSLFHLGHPITLKIVGNSKGMTWQVELPRVIQDVVTRSLLSFYPQADIDNFDAQKITGIDDIDEDYCYCNACGVTLTLADTVCENCGFGFDNDSDAFVSMGGAVEFVSPLVYAQECKTFDPLIGIIGAMSNLESGETVIYRVEITPTDRNYRQEGYKKIRKDPMLYVAGGILTTALDAGLALDHAINNPGKSRRPLPQVKVPASLDKFESHLQRLFEAKLDAPLLSAHLNLRVQSPHGERRGSIMTGLINATRVFDRNDGNALTTGDKQQALVLAPQEIASLWHLPTEGIRTPGIVRTSGAKAPLPVELMQSTQGIYLGLNAYQVQTRPVYLATGDRITHMNIVGKTRVGKTTFMHNLIHQDIAAGRGVAVIDPHGDLVRDILESSIPPEREDDVVLFDLADTKHPVPLNLLYVPQGVPRHTAVGLTIGVLKKIFAEQWSATRMEDALYSALSVLVDIEGATIRDIPRLFLDEEYRANVLAQTHDEVALEYWHEDYERMSEGYQREVARPIMNRIRAFYRNPVIRAIVDQPESIDMRAIMDNKKIFLASLAGESTQAESSTIGALLISKIQMAAMGRANMSTEERRMFYLYIDEVQNFVTTSLPVMFSEAAKYALSLTVANQFLRQLAGDTLEAVLGNTGTTVMFACGSQDAQDLGAYVKPVFDSQALLNLDRFHTIVKMQKEGKTLPAFNMQTPEPPAKPEDASETAARIRNKALEAYTQVVVEEAEQRPESSVPEMSVPATDKDGGDVPTLKL